MKYLIIIIMACSLYSQSMMTGWYRDVDTDSAVDTMTIYNNTIYFLPESLEVMETKYGIKVTSICKKDSSQEYWIVSDNVFEFTNMDNVWFNYATSNIDYRKSFDDEVAIMLIIQSPRSLKIYKWLREKGYDPMESVRRTNTFADKEKEIE